MILFGEVAQNILKSITEKFAKEME